MIANKYENGISLSGISPLKLKLRKSQTKLKSLYSNAYKARKSCSRKRRKNDKFNNLVSIKFDYLTVCNSQLPLDKLDSFLEFCSAKKEGKGLNIVSGKPFRRGEKAKWYSNSIFSLIGIEGGYTINEKLIDDDVCIRRIVAENPNTPVNILKQLAESVDINSAGTF